MSSTAQPSSVLNAFSQPRGITLAPWVQQAKESKRDDLLILLDEFAVRNGLQFAAPYHTFNHSLTSDHSPRGSREELKALLSKADLQLLSEVQIAKVMPITKRDQPFSTPAGYSVELRPEKGEYRLYPTAGSAWRFETPDRTRAYVSQAGLAVRQVAYDTLVGSGRRLGLSVMAIHDYDSSPRITNLAPEQMSALESAYQPVLDQVHFHTQYYDLQKMVKQDETSLAVHLVRADFDYAVFQASERLQSLGWTIEQVTLVRDEEGKMKNWLGTSTGVDLL